MSFLPRLWRLKHVSSIWYVTSTLPCSRKICLRSPHSQARLPNNVHVDIMPQINKALLFVTQPPRKNGTASSKTTAHMDLR